MSKKPRWRVIYRYICRSTRNPESVARGMGLGLFIGFLPAIGFQLFVAFLMAGLFNANRIVTMLATLVTNPFTAIPVSAFSVWLGEWVLPGNILTTSVDGSFQFSDIFDSPGRLGISYLVGCLILSSVAGIIGYFGMHLICILKKRIKIWKFLK